MPQYSIKFAGLYIEKQLMSIIILALFFSAILLASCQDYNKQKDWEGECQTGHKQSPVNIITENLKRCASDYNFTLTSKDDLYTQIAYNHSNINLLTPYTLSTLTIQQNQVTKVYNAVQFHLHHPSDHQINGKSQDLEFHVLHQADDKSLAVYSVLFQVSTTISKDPFDSWNLDTTTDIQQKLPIKLELPTEFYHYQGSLTTPPCTEGVNWFINANPVLINKSSLDKLAQMINQGHSNNREIHPINDRVIDDNDQICFASAHFGLAKPRHLLTHS